MLLPFLILSLIITAIYSLSVLREGGREIGNDEKTASPTSVSRMDGVRIINTKDGIRQWTLNSHEIEIAGDSVRISGVDARVRGIEMDVAASLGIYDMASGGLDLSGGVKMTGNDYSIITSEASLESTSGRFYSDEEVVVEGRGFRISGSGLFAEKQEIRILRDVQAVFY